MYTLAIPAGPTELGRFELARQHAELGPLIEEGVVGLMVDVKASTKWSDEQREVLFALRLPYMASLPRTLLMEDDIGPAEQIAGMFPEAEMYTIDALHLPVVDPYPGKMFAEVAPGHPMTSEYFMEALENAKRRIVAIANVVGATDAFSEGNRVAIENLSGWQFGTEGGQWKPWLYCAPSLGMTPPLLYDLVCDAMAEIILDPAHSYYMWCALNRIGSHENNWNNTCAKPPTTEAEIRMLAMYGIYIDSGGHPAVPDYRQMLGNREPWMVHLSPVSFEVADDPRRIMSHRAFTSATEVAETINYAHTFCNFMNRGTPPCSRFGMDCAAPWNGDVTEQFVQSFGPLARWFRTLLS